MRTLLCLQASAKHLVRVSGGSGADLAQKGGAEDAEPVRTMIVRWVLAHLQACESHLEVFVQWELDCDVCEAEECRCETGVEGADSLSAVHHPCCINGGLVVPGRSYVGRRVSADLRHQPCLDDPDRIGGHC